MSVASALGQLFPTPCHSGRKVGEALMDLNDLIAAGKEFPDAVVKIVRKHKLDERSQDLLEKAYDLQDAS